MSVPTTGEEESEPELVRRDDFLASPSDPRSIPSQVSNPDVVYARNRVHALWIRMRTAVRRAFSQRHPVPLTVDECEIVEDNLADGSVNPIPTIDASPLVIRRPHQGDPEHEARHPDKTTVWVGLKVLETLEITVGFITSRTSLVRAFVFLAVTSAALGTVALLSLLIPDVPDPVLAASLWGLLIVLVGGPVFGIGLWFVDRKVDRKHDHGGNTDGKRNRDDPGRDRH
ncbi:hypothetical protein AB0M02_43000 [Actinoplanes sp. NPDC051861]|uniref:hypothetical protein n=1 Tax=Actinoplanes sp. NPDC051861 TaxID=3155170 RepID=UPI0034419E01